MSRVVAVRRITPRFGVGASAFRTVVALPIGVASTLIVFTANTVSTARVGTEGSRGRREGGEQEKDRKSVV